MLSKIIYSIYLLPGDYIYIYISGYLEHLVRSKHSGARISLMCGTSKISRGNSCGFHGLDHTEIHEQKWEYHLDSICV